MEIVCTQINIHFLEYNLGCIKEFSKLVRYHVFQLKLLFKNSIILGFKNC